MTDAWGELRILEFVAEHDTLRAAGSDELTAAMLAFDSLIADIADRLDMDSAVVSDVILTACAERSAENKIITWLRRQMPEPSL